MEERTSRLLRSWSGHAVEAFDVVDVMGCRVGEWNATLDNDEQTN
jgi:hypothetical protein